MNDFIEHLRGDLNEIWLQIRTLYAKLLNKPLPEGSGKSVVTSTISTNYETNLVPAVKLQMIKAQKVRNLVLFICIVVSGVAVGAVVILFGIKSGQDIVMAGQDSRIEQMSKKLSEYDELNDLLTIQGQLDGISEITARKTVLSRVFGALSVMLPQGGDSVKMSELRVNLTTNMLTMEGQADARVTPLIDYRVLESFKKGVALTKYDYGTYVDANGTPLPTQCVKETDAAGNAYRDGNNFFAWWDLTIEDCEGVRRSITANGSVKYYYSNSAEVEMGVPGYETRIEEICDENGQNCRKNLIVLDENGSPIDTSIGVIDEETGEETNPYSPVPVRVKIWRTPQFTDWHNAGQMALDGSITNVEHFVSECYKYSGSNTTGTVKWTSTNDCMLAADGLAIASSSNGRDESDNLVLKFTASAILNESFFAFANKHMMAIGPMGQNVTDSYIQIGNMFAKEARECDPADTECLLNSQSVTEGN